MSSPKTCPRCGATLPTDHDERRPCPRCLMGAGMASAAGRPQTIPVPTLEELAPLFPKLEIDSLIGQGGMGCVYKARHVELDRTIALKVLNVEVQSDPSFDERFAREARAMASLSHPCIASVHDFGRAGDFTYLMLEYVDGANVRQLIRAKTVGPRQALSMVGQISDALQYAHDRGVVHRDIKPENILVDKAGQVKIVDFGLAKVVGIDDDNLGLTGTHQAMGTFHYMAPEQYERPLEVDHRADIFSLGVVFYELLTGELPMGRFSPPSEKVQVDVRLDDVVLKSLEKEPEKRYQRVVSLKTAVEDIGRSGSVGRNEPVAKRAVAGRTERTPMSSGNKTLLIVLAIVVGLPFMLGCLFVVPWLFLGVSYSGAEAGTSRPVPAVLEQPAETTTDERR